MHIFTQRLFLLLFTVWYEDCNDDRESDNPGRDTDESVPWNGFLDVELVGRLGEEEGIYADSAGEDH